MCGDAADVAQHRLRRNDHGAGKLFAFDVSLPGGFVDGFYAQTMAFTTLMLFQIFNVINARSDETSARGSVASDSSALEAGDPTRTTAQMSGDTWAGAPGKSGKAGSATAR